MQGNGKPDDDGEEQTLELTLGPKASRFLQQIREKIGSPEEPASYTVALNYALRVANWCLDRRAEGLKVAAVTEITEEDDNPPWEE